MYQYRKIDINFAQDVSTHHPNKKKIVNNRRIHPTNVHNFCVTSIHTSLFYRMITLNPKNNQINIYDKQQQHQRTIWVNLS